MAANPSDAPEEPWETAWKAGQALGEALATFGYTLTAQAALAHLLIGEHDKAKQVLQKLPAGPAARARRAAADMAQLLGGSDPTPKAPE